MPRLSFAALLFACTGLGACAMGPAVPPAPAEWRVLVKLAEASTDRTAIARQAEDIGGVPVRYVSAATLQWHALALVCTDDAGCAAALERLRAATSTYAKVEREERRQPHSPS
jgi:hypothetical protein